MSERAEIFEKSRTVVDYWSPNMGSITFYCKDQGDDNPAYVWAVGPETIWQVCEYLSNTGSTLTCGPGERLINVIRREHKRAWQRNRRRWGPTKGRFNKHADA